MTLNQFIYRVSRPLGALKLAKFLSRKHPKILMYHRITDSSDGQGITVEQFRKHVEIIKSYFSPMTLRDLLRAYEKGSVPENTVVITFDDGYSDFAELAFPILEKEQVPATLFVTTGFVNGDIWLWPDQIRYAISKTKINNIKLPAIEKSLDVATDPQGCWNVIANYCISIPNEKKLSFIDQVFRQLQVEKPNIVPDEFRPLSWLQIRDMTKRGLDIGSHSISHPILTKLSDQELFKELSQSKHKLMEEVNQEIDVFCYPNGSPDDFDKRVQDFIRRSGYNYAVSAFPDKKPISNSFCINRYPVGRSLEIFEKNIFGLSFLEMMT